MSYSVPLHPAEFAEDHAGFQSEDTLMKLARAGHVLDRITTEGDFDNL